MADSETAPEVAEAAAPVEAQPATSTPEPTVTLKQMQAADAARVKAQQERDQVKADLEAARRALAERDEKDMSDLEVAQKQRDRYKAEVETERAERVRAQMALKYPNAVADLDGEPLPSEAALERMEARAKAASPAPEVIPEPRMDANNPRKTTAAPAQKTADDMRATLITEAAKEVERVHPF